MMQSLLQPVNDIWGIYCIDKRFIYSLEGNDWSQILKHQQ